MVEKPCDDDCGYDHWDDWYGEEYWVSCDDWSAWCSDAE